MFLRVTVDDSSVEACGRAELAVVNVISVHLPNCGARMFRAVWLQ